MVLHSHCSQFSCVVLNFCCFWLACITLSHVQWSWTVPPLPNHTTAWCTIPAFTSHGTSRPNCVDSHVLPASLSSFPVWCSDVSTAICTYLFEIIVMFSSWILWQLQLQLCGFMYPPRKILNEEAANLRLDTGGTKVNSQHQVDD